MISYRRDYCAVFLISLFSIALELFITRILDLKTWNHVTYILIPFAMLGYGAGTNIYILFRKHYLSADPDKTAGTLLLLSSITAVFISFALMRLPVKLYFLTHLLESAGSAFSIMALCALMTVPFILPGFLTSSIFAAGRARRDRLYFADLSGAASGAIVFFIFIGPFQVIHSIALLSLMLAGSSFIYLGRKYSPYIYTGLLFSAIIIFLPEPADYSIDPGKGWENIPGNFNSNEYKNIFSKWTPLGRTDAYLLRGYGRELILHAGFTMLTTLQPVPEYAYFCNNFLSGSPVFRLTPEYLEKTGIRHVPFSSVIETPYLLLDRPRVVIIGTGGGRDIFTAMLHDASEIAGAEINPAVYQAMSKGGPLFNYSGGIYADPVVRIVNLDGRHFVKTLKPGAYDLVLLNGVDTFTGLSSGAYAYAESYLYTRNAVTDYLRLLKDNGMINFNRWLFHEKPRETLRLFVIALEALKRDGAKEPWKHIVIGKSSGWGVTLIKKTPFSENEKKALFSYFSSHEMEPVYPTDYGTVSPQFGLYAEAFKAGRAGAFMKEYAFDISPVTDDKPFFYKYYKLKDFSPFHPALTTHPVAGTIVFMTQAFILLSALLGIAIFILIPLKLTGREGSVSSGINLPAFAGYFGCLGIGYMFLEICFMQKFVLLLGSPIYSISITLAALLLSSGLGSLASGKMILLAGSKARAIASGAAALGIYLFLLSGTPGSALTESLISYGFVIRAAMTALLLFPAGFIAGIFFPTGLDSAGSADPANIPWAWGINCGFSVLGSILAIIIAQFAGFSTVIACAVLVYLTAAACFPFILKKQ